MSSMSSQSVYRSYEYLEERRVFYAIRLPSNRVLQYEIAPLLIRPVGRPPKCPVILYDDFWYRAGSWDRARRVVAKVEWHRGELFPRVGFIVTNMTAGPEGVVRFYNSTPRAGRCHSPDIQCPGGQCGQGIHRTQEPGGGHGGRGYSLHTLQGQY